MGEPTFPQPAMLILAAFSRHAEALEWAEERAVGAWGPVEMKSPAFDFTETEYYTPTMGPGIKKVFFAFDKPFDPAELVECKLTANAWEAEYANLPSPRPLRGARRGAGGEGGVDDAAKSSPHPNPLPKGEGMIIRHPEPRPLNLDPGYLTLGKLVLASTKDFAHRIYLHSGVYAEVTLFYKHHRWQHHEYTFADYRRADYQRFLSECRERLHEKLKMRSTEC
jgi:hypothetical protein